MACEIIKKEFGEDVFSTRQLSATRALDTYIKLSKTFNNVILPFIDEKYHFMDIIELMKAGSMEEIKDIIYLASYNGESITKNNFDKIFESNMMLVFHVFSLVLSSNYKDFFASGLALNEQRQKEFQEQQNLIQQ